MPDDVCPYHKEMTEKQGETFKLLDGKVPVWVFTLIMAVFVGLIGTISMIQFGIISTNTSSMSIKMDTVMNSLNELKTSQIGVESSINILSNKFDTFKKYSEKEHEHFNKEIEDVKRAR